MIQISLGFLKSGTKKALCYSEDSTKFSLDLPNSKIYDVSLDQSHTCTGICVKPMDDSFIIIMEVLNIGTPNEFYRKYLKSFLKTLLKGHKIRYMIMEEPLGYITGRQNRRLIELKKDLSTLKEELNPQVFTTVPVTSWRHGLMPKKNGMDRRSKEAVVSTVLELYPALVYFLELSNSDKDGFEAVGILHGYFARHGVNSDMIKNVGSTTTRKKAFCCFKYIDLNTDDISHKLDLECYVLRQMANSKAKGDFVLKEYNKEFNVHGNAKMALTNSVSVMVVNEDLDALAILFRMGLKPKPNHALLMGVVHEKIMDAHYLTSLHESGFSLYKYY